MVRSVVRAERWLGRLDGWLEPFLAALPRVEQRGWAPPYLRGLLLPGERKSVEPMAARVCPGRAQGLHRVVSASPWPTDRPERVLAERAEALIGGPDAVLVVDDTARVKQGRHAAGRASISRPRSPPCRRRACSPTHPMRRSARLSWRVGTKSALRAAFNARRLRIADGPLTTRRRRLPGEERWLVCEHRPSGERRFHLTSHPANASLQDLAAAIKRRWCCEQAHQQLKEELGLDHYEGRGWQGLHHHALLCQLALAVLQAQRIGGKTKPTRTSEPGPPTQHTLPEVRRRITAAIPHPLRLCPPCTHRLPWHMLL